MENVIGVVLIALAVLSTAWDIKTYRIPNWLTFGGMTAGLVLGGIANGLQGVQSSLTGLLAGGLILLPFFLLGGMGGGDVKLAAAFGAIGGAYFVFNALLIGAIAGGVSGIIVLFVKFGIVGAFKKLYWDLAALFVKVKPAVDEKMVLPYGVFLSLGAVLSYFVGGVLIAL